VSGLVKPEPEQQVTHAGAQPRSRPLRRAVITLLHLILRRARLDWKMVQSEWTATTLSLAPLFGHRLQIA
jgi:hypothetical protein